MSTVFLDLYSLADLRQPAAVRAIGHALDEDARLRPARMDVRDPIRQKIVSAEDYLGSIEAPNAQGTERYLYDRRAAPRHGGGIAFARRAPEELTSPHRIYLSMAEEEVIGRPELVDAIAALFVRLADGFDAFYGFVTHSKLPWQQRVELLEATRQGMVVPLYPTMATDRTSVRDVYWLNYYGPAFVERWGARIDTAGTHQVRVDNGGRVVWAADTPFLYDPNVTDTSQYPWKQSYYDAVGRDSFVHRHQMPGMHVPTWDDHRRFLRVR
jgi:hypothetical protein